MFLFKYSTLCLENTPMSLQVDFGRENFINVGPTALERVIITCILPGSLSYYGKHNSGRQNDEAIFFILLKILCDLPKFCPSRRLIELHQALVRIIQDRDKASAIQSQACNIYIVETSLIYSFILQTNKVVLSDGKTSTCGIQ